MRNRLLALVAALGMAVLATWAPKAEATIYCSDSFCASRPEEAPCICSPMTDKAGETSNCAVWNSIAGGGCWYF